MGVFAFHTKWDEDRFVTAAEIGLTSPGSRGTASRFALRRLATQ